VAGQTFTVTQSGPAAVLTIAKSHVGGFLHGQNGATYTVTVSNTAGAGATGGTVTVAETVPTGLTLASMAGTGWSCTGSTCTRSDSLNAGASYPPITVTVNVSATAASLVTNVVTVSGGGAVQASASDPTNIGGLQFYPMTPCRVADTRTSAGMTGRLGPPYLTGQTSRSFPVQSGSCAVPANATGVLSEHHGGAADGLPGVSDHLAYGTTTAGGIDAQRMERDRSGQRGARPGGDQWRDQHLCVRQHRCLVRHQTATSRRRGRAGCSSIR